MTDTTNLPAVAPVKSTADKKPRAPRKPAAVSAKPFSVAELARELKLDPKVARRRMRANVARTKPLPTPKGVANASRKNARYEYEGTAANRAMITAIIKTPE